MTSASVSFFANPFLRFLTKEWVKQWNRHRDFWIGVFVVNMSRTEREWHNNLLWELKSFITDRKDSYSNEKSALNLSFNSRSHILPEREKYLMEMFSYVLIQIASYSAAKLLLQLMLFSFQMDSILVSYLQSFVSNILQAYNWSREIPFANRKIIKWFRLEGIFKDLVQLPCQVQECLILDEVSQSPVQPDLECFLFGQPIPVPNQPCGKKCLSNIKSESSLFQFGTITPCPIHPECGKNPFTV